MLDNVAQDFEGDEKGPPLSDKIAEVITKMVKGKMPDDKLKSKLANYPCPDNVQTLKPTRVNQIIWDKLRSATRSRDLKLQRIQVMILKGIIALGKGAQQVLNLPGVDKSAIHELFDAIAFMAQGSLETNLARRELIKPDLSKEFQHLCSSAVPITSQLFSDDISKYVKDIRDSSKMGLKIARGGSTNRFRPYRGRPYRGRMNSSFLARGRSSQRFPYTKHHPQNLKEGKKE